ncbi:MAG: hypothetical protein AABW91_02970 [Nanoarchaeota archaeon]
MKSKDWAILIVVVIVIALVVSLVTVNLTGNVIKLNQDRFGKYNVYTKEEVDQLIGPLMTRDKVSAHFRAIVPTYIGDTSLAGITTRSSFTCDEICSKRSDAAKLCIGGFVKQGNDKDVTYLARPITRCDESISVFTRTTGAITMQTPLCMCAIQM